MPSLLPPFATMYRAVLQRESAFEGIFYFAVRTTGIFCRPTCPSKKPARENVEFFGTASEAKGAGYRACLRCRPDEDVSRRAPKILEQLRAAIEEAPGGRLTDKELDALSIDASTARRQFKRHYGVTFQAYQRAQRIAGAAQVVREQKRVDAARMMSGFQSASGFREAFTRMFGSAPLSANVKESLIIDRIETPLGPMLAIANDRGLHLAEFADFPGLDRQLAQLRRRFDAPILPGQHRCLDDARTQLSEYFAGTRTRFDLPLVLSGTPFQRRTLELLQTIPHGETRSYSWMADQIGLPGARRAVGRANGSNMICILVPCHRVIRADGTLGGYSAGVWRKKWLLAHERKVVDQQR